MARKSFLKLYRKRRNLKKSGEPRGSSKRPKETSGKNPIFVIQEHDARNLHYDFRLEIDGVLKSWAIPKGPSTDPKIKRLAMPTDDHPMEYASFEGVIPEGNYGAGPVIIWDHGTYINIRKKSGKVVPMDECFKAGKIEVDLHGKKIKGSYVLFRMGGQKDKEQWLFKKMVDEHADARRNKVSTQPKSVVSGKTIKQMAKDPSAVWECD